MSKNNTKKNKAWNNVAEKWLVTNLSANPVSHWLMYNLFCVELENFKSYRITKSEYHLKV